MPNDKKTFREAMLCWNTAKWVASIALTAAILGAGVLVTYYTAEGAQEGRISVQAEKSIEIQTELDSHVQHADKTFREINHTMREQRTLIQDTRETLSGMAASQQAIKETQGRIFLEIQKINNGN